MNISYICSGDFLLPDLKLPEETRPIGKWGRMHRDYFEEHHPIQFNNLVLSGNLCCSLCTAYEHKAFLDVLQYGAHLIRELDK